MKKGFVISLNCTLSAIIGALPHERKNAQEIIIDLRVKYKRKCESESESKFESESSFESAHKNTILDYAALHAKIMDIFENNQFIYLEDAINFTLDSIKHDFYGIRKAKMRITKPHILPNCVASVSVKRKFPVKRKFLAKRKFPAKRKFLAKCDFKGRKHSFKKAQKCLNAK